MIATFTKGKRSFKIDTEEPLNISIPLNFTDSQPNYFGVEKATSHPYQSESLIGDTKQGGSCNFDALKLTPHCNGTHTECMGHITHENISLNDILTNTWFLVELITIHPVKAGESADTYTEFLEDDDLIIDKNSIQISLTNAHQIEGIVIRTHPNDETKLNKTYSSSVDALYFSNEAMVFFEQLKINHLIVDLPTIDRIEDGGLLSNHHTFWHIPIGTYITNNATIHKTITELAYIPNEILDGLYMINLQVAPLVSDASPSRPILFKVIDE